jgi:hypothetical protein
MEFMVVKERKERNEEVGPSALWENPSKSDRIKAIRVNQSDQSKTGVFLAEGGG